MLYCVKSGWGGAWIKRREVMDGKLREHQYRKEYARSLEGKRVDWDGENKFQAHVRAGETGNG